ncbi:helicase, partial [Catellatospora methionotrophica]
YGGDWSVDDVPLLDELNELLGEPPAAPAARVEPARLRELTMGPQLVDTFVLSLGLHDGWSLYAPGLPTPMAVAGQSIDNDAIAQAQRWAAAIILREGHQVVSWIDGYDPYGEDGYVPVLAEPLPVAEPDDEPATWDDYAHVILDEAQDLSPMECRMIARRAAYASMTIVGDLGQATHPLAAATWRELLARLARRDARTLDLRTGYRVPQVLAAFAARMLAPGIAPTQSYRPGGDLSVRQVDDLAAAAREAARRAPGEGSVAVVVADHMSGAIAAAVDAPHVTVVPAGLVKGLEYDHVIVVEPAAIVAAEPRGQQRLYVVLTRAVASLEILHHEPLPAALASEPPARP